jgi:hypothetical protein
MSTTALGGDASATRDGTDDDGSAGAGAGRTDVDTAVGARRGSGSIASFYTPGADYVHLPPVPPTTVARRRGDISSAAASSQDAHGSASSAALGAYGPLPTASPTAVPQGARGAAPTPASATSQGSGYGFLPPSRQAPTLQGVQSSPSSAAAVAGENRSQYGGLGVSGRSTLPSRVMVRDDGSELLVHDVSDV